MRLFGRYDSFGGRSDRTLSEYAPCANEVAIPVRGEGALYDLTFAGACVDEFVAADIDRGMIDTIARIALEEQQIAFFQIIDGIDTGPGVVLGIGMRAAPADLYARFRQTVVDESGTVERIGSFIAENVRVTELIPCAADHAVNAV